MRGELVCGEDRRKMVESDDGDDVMGYGGDDSGSGSNTNDM